MQRALSLVQKDAMEIAPHSIYSFARNFGGSHHLEIHSDGSLDAWDLELLMAAATGISAEIVTPKQRGQVVSNRLAEFPKTLALTRAGGHITKLELPIYHNEPFFYFDSDVIWLSPVRNLVPPSGESAFSTEAWSSHFGNCGDSLRIKGDGTHEEDTGFYYLSKPFPVERMETLLERQELDPAIAGGTDREIMAYLYPEMLIYDPEDVKRSRAGKTYDLANLDSAALHFPGRMWQGHMDQIKHLEMSPPPPPRTIRFIEPTKLNHLKLFLTQAYGAIVNSTAARAPSRVLSKLRGCLDTALPQRSIPKNHLKVLLRQVAEYIVANNTVWAALSGTLVRGSQFLCSVRDVHEVEQIIARNDRLRDALATKTVIAGSFEGMKYGTTRAFCSTLHPKLLGIYENELSGIISTALAKKYQTIVDVGAADGYYAVGFAYKDPEARVVAFEMDSRARTELAKLREINGVTDRVEVRGKCEPQDLLALEGNRGLMIMDCEGYEEQLLTSEVITHLKDWDFIIETHDGFSPEITTRLTTLFKTTHEVIPVEVIHDQNKADHVELPILEGLPRRDVDKLLSENRQHACLRWIACYAKACGS